MRRFYTIAQSKSAKQSRMYPNGDPIPETLPESYQLSQECGSCAAYLPLSKNCSMYNAPVLTDYWCATWKAK